MPAAPISFYVQIEEGRVAEIEAVARALLEFAAGVREIAYVYDPSFEFRLEFERGEEGSLWIKAVLRWIRGLGFAKPTLYGIATASTLWFLNQVGDKAFDAAWAKLVGEEAAVQGIPPEQAEEMVQKAARAAANEVAARHFRGVYRELGKDSAITGVGVSTSHARPPQVIIPRAQFEARASSDVGIIVPGQRRTRSVRGDYIIIRPVLKEGGGRWRLRGPEGEFSATIADDEFYNNILAGSAPVAGAEPVPFAGDLHINADLETTDEQTPEGAWKPVAHRVTKVYGISRPPQQSRLIGPRE